MGHNVGTQAAKAVERSEKKQAKVLRTPEERLKDIRNECEPSALLSITKDDTRFLLGLYDGVLAALKDAQQRNEELKTMLVEKMNGANAEISRLNAQIDQFRSVYEQENRSTKVQVERAFPGNTTQVQVQAEVPRLLQPEGVVDIAATVAQKAGLRSVASREKFDDTGAAQDFGS